MKLLPVGLFFFSSFFLFFFFAELMNERTQCTASLWFGTGLKQRRCAAGPRQLLTAPQLRAAALRLLVSPPCFSRNYCPNLRKGHRPKL